MYDSLKTNNEGHHCPPGAYSRCVAVKGGGGGGGTPIHN